MRRPWTRHRWRPAAPEPMNHTCRLPDGDTVLAPGQRRSVLFAAEARRAALAGPTMMLNRRLLTRLQGWRAAGGRAPIGPEVRR